MTGGGGNVVSVEDELLEEVDEGLDEVDDGTLDVLEGMLEVDEVATEVLEVLVSTEDTLVVDSWLDVETSLEVEAGLLQPVITKPERIAKNNNCFFIMTQSPIYLMMIA